MSKLTRPFGYSLLFAALLTSVVTLWEWLENPGGIFHGEQGTDWPKLLETATSWLIPAFCYALLLSVILRLISAFVHLIRTLARDADDKE